MLQLEVLKQIQAELVNLRHEVTNVKAEVTSVRTELKAEIASVRSELRAEMHEGFIRVRTELVGLRDDMEVGFTALRIQNDRRFIDQEGRLRALETGR